MVSRIHQCLSFQGIQNSSSKFDLGTAKPTTNDYSETYKHRGRDSFGKSSNFQTEKQKFNLGTYNNGQFTKSYNPKVFNENYQTKTLGYGKAKPLPSTQVEKDKRLNSIGFWDMLGCGGR